jgi:salicylate hydroxylase
MDKRMLVIGGGIGGLAAALACARAGVAVELFERASEFTEVGAGVQLGPNVVKLLDAWGLQDALTVVAAFPDRLQVRSAITGAELGVLRLGERMVQQYGARYATIHRADLQALLLAGARKEPGVRLNLNSEFDRFEQNDAGVMAHMTDGRAMQADLLLGADGGWSRVRQRLLNDGAPSPTGKLAYRAMVEQRTLPQYLRSTQVTAWLGPDLHVIQYPVRGGDWLNVVVIVHGQVQRDIASWDHRANAGTVRHMLKQTCVQLQDLVQVIGHWRLWGLSIRPPMRGAREQAQGRVALLGDAAHPMVPFLAQGAGMAIEDAQALSQALASPAADVPAALQRYAGARWQRNARVQAGALRNGEVFHATGVVRWGRDLAMKMFGERLLDLPWLYHGPA